MDEYSFIFYLTLEEDLPHSFYVFDRTLRERGMTLVPIKVDQLQSLMASSEQSQIVVISSVTDSREFKLFNLKIRPLLKFIMRNNRLSFLMLSSFSKLNDNRLYASSKKYFFMKYPLNAESLAHSIENHLLQKQPSNSRWPGGRRPGLLGPAA